MQSFIDMPLSKYLEVHTTYIRYIKWNCEVTTSSLKTLIKMTKDPDPAENDTAFHSFTAKLQGNKVRDGTECASGK